MENNEKTKLEEAGAFWIKKSKTGTQFLTGKVKSKSGEEISVIVFKNKYKTEGSNQPDYRIYFDNGPKNNVEVSAPKTVEAKTTAPTAPKAVEAKTSNSSKVEAKTELMSEDIPF